MSMDPSALPGPVLDFLVERHLATLTTLRPDGSPHVVPVGFAFDPSASLVRIISFRASRKVANLHARPGGRAVVCQVDGARWLSLEGPATVSAEPGRVRAAEEAYSRRYRTPGQRADRVAIEIAVDRVLGRA